MTHRRLAAEWGLLQRLAAVNPDRLDQLSAEDLTFHLRLRQTPALPLPGQDLSFPSAHLVRITYPSFFPAAPLELYLTTPVQHPNIHPQTGFVCLWDRHRVSNNVELALHKLVAILGWRLYNRDTVHVMQKEALKRLEDPDHTPASLLEAPSLRGLRHSGFEVAGAVSLDGADPAIHRRRRLS